MKRHIWIVALLVLCVVMLPAERLNMQIVVTAGTPIRIASQKMLASRFTIQSRHSNTGLIYVLLGVKPTTACDATNTTQLSLELGPGDATHPGQSMSDPQGANGMTPADAEDLSWACIDGTVNGDKALITLWRKN